MPVYLLFSTNECAMHGVTLRTSTWFKHSLVLYTNTIHGSVFQVLQRRHCTCHRQPQLCPLCSHLRLPHSHQEHVYCLADCRLHIRNMGTDNQKERQKQSEQTRWSGWANTSLGRLASCPEYCCSFCHRRLPEYKHTDSQSTAEGPPGCLE